MRTSDLIKGGKGVKIINGIYLHTPPQADFFRQEVKELLARNVRPKQAYVLRLKAEFIVNLRESSDYKRYNEWITTLSYEEKIALLSPKDTLEAGCFGLIESWYEDTPNNKWQRVVFIGESLIGDFLGIELNPSNLSIVEGLAKVGNICSISSTGGAQLNHKLLAVI